MEEITIRFEIVRLAVKMADHETIAIQAKKLQELSLDEDLNEIIALLESRNYRQALFLMKGYIQSLDDSFFEKPAAAPAPKKQPKEPPREPQNLFDMMQPQTPKTLNLDDMLRMTEESAEESVVHEEPQVITDRYVSQLKERVEENEAYLDIHKNRAENKAIKPFELPEKEVSVDIEGNPVEIAVADEPSSAREESSVDNIPSQPELSEREEQVEISSVATQEVHSTAMEEAAEVSDQTLSESLESEEEPEPLSVQEVASDLESEQEVSASEVLAEVLEANESQPAEKSSQPQAEAEESSPIEEVPEGAEEISMESLLTEDPLEVDTPMQPQHRSAVPEQVQRQEAEAPTQTLKQVSAELAAAAAKAEITEPEPRQTPQIKRKEDYTKENRRYPPISYIDQKFRNMRHQFPQVEELDGIIDEVKRLLTQMSTEGYTDNDIKDAISFFQQKKSEGNIAEAAQMLLIAAASESKYAQLLLARELFKGEVLKTDYPEAFTQINRLAEHDYPEAVCDLAQLYEYGYGIKKDKKTALLLYEEAAEMGVARAQKHVERLSRKKGILSSFFK